MSLTEIPIEVRKLRDETGLSQNRFAAYFGIPCQTYQQWERKERTPSPYIPQMMDRNPVQSNRWTKEDYLSKVKHVIL